MDNELQLQGGCRRKSLTCNNLEFMRSFSFYLKIGSDLLLSVMFCRKIEHA